MLYNFQCKPRKRILVLLSVYTNWNMQHSIRGVPRSLMGDSLLNQSDRSSHDRVKGYTCRHSAYML